MRPTRGQRIAAWIFAIILLIVSYGVGTGPYGASGGDGPASIAALFGAIGLILWALAPKRLDG